VGLKYFLTNGKIVIFIMYEDVGRTFRSGERKHSATCGAM